MRTGVTLIDITRAADQLLAGGERPTVDGVRRVLGTGSPNTVNALLKDYYQALPGRLNLPAPIATAAAELYDKVRATAMDEVDAEREAMQRETALDRDQLAADRRAFEAEKGALKSEVVSLTSKVEQLLEQQRMLAGKASHLERDLATQTERAAGAEAQVRAADEERDRTALKHAGELQRVREQAEGNERHLLSRVDEHKTQYQRLQTERERDGAAAAKRIGALETSLSEALKVQASLRADVAAAQRDLGKRGEALTVAENSIQRLHEESGREAAGHQRAMEQLRVEAQRASTLAEQLKRERDDAIREAARIEGKMSALQSQLEEARVELSRLQHLRPVPVPDAKI